MKKINFFIVFVCITLFSSCEKTELIEVEIDDVEKVVVEGEIKTGEIFNGVRITRTVPIGSEYNIKAAEIKDAYVYLQIDSVKTVPLHYFSNGIYAPLNELIIEAGKVYELFGKVRENPIYAKTIAPVKPDVLFVRHNDEGYLQAAVNTVEEQAYGALWIVSANVIIKADNFYSVQKGQSANHSLTVRTKQIDDKYLSSSYTGRRMIQVFSFDKQFEAYFNTKAQISPGESGVITGGSGVAWNIVGTNAIGMFIGIASQNAIPVF